MRSLIDAARSTTELTVVMHTIDFKLYVKYGTHSYLHETYLETADRLEAISEEFANLFRLAEDKWFELENARVLSNA